MAEDCRPQQHTHSRHFDFLPLPFFGWGLVCPLIRLFVVSAWLFCCLVPLARTSYSVRGVGCSRPEPWTRLHCSELHWRDPVALSAGQSGAPVSSKACAHGWVSFSDQRLISWPTRRESGVYSGFPGWPIVFAMLQCTAGTLLRRRHSGSTWTVLQIFFSLAPPRQCVFWWWVYSYGKHGVRHKN